MAIHQITKDEFDAVKRRRKLYPSQQTKGFLIFKGADGHYYKTDDSGMLAVKEITEFNKNYRLGIQNQTKLI